MGQQPARGLRVGDDGRERLIELVRQRRRELAHRRDARHVRELGARRLRFELHPLALRDLARASRRRRHRLTERVDGQHPVAHAIRPVVRVLEHEVRRLARQDRTDAVERRRARSSCSASRRHAASRLSPTDWPVQQRPLSPPGPVQCSLTAMMRAVAVEDGHAARQRSENRRLERLARTERVLGPLAGHRIAEDLGDETESRDHGGRPVDRLDHRHVPQNDPTTRSPDASGNPSPATKP